MSTLGCRVCDDGNLPVEVHGNPVMLATVAGASRWRDAGVLDRIPLDELLDDTDDTDEDGDD